MELKPCDDSEVMRLWRECGLPEYFLGNGGTNHKLVAFAKKCAALSSPHPEDGEAVEAARKIIAAADRFNKCRAEFPIEKDWDFDACSEWENALHSACLEHGEIVARALLSISHQEREG